MNAEILYQLGWSQTFSQDAPCVVCRKTVFRFGWASPGYKFYHDECLENSPRYKKIERAAQTTNKGDGVQTGAKDQSAFTPRLI